MHRGFITLHRKFLDFEWYQDGNTMRVFIHCLIKANFQNKKWHGIEIERGSFLTSIDTLKNELKLTCKKVRTSLTKLEKSENLAIKTTNRYSVISVCNYDTYQDKINDNGKQKGKQRANKGQTEGKQRATTNTLNNVNHVNNENKKKELSKDEIKLNELLKHEYFNNSEFSELWDEFCKSKKEKCTVNAKKRGLMKLFKVSLDQSISALENSVSGGWAGLFTDNKTNQQKKEPLTWKQKQKKMFADEIKRLKDVKESESQEASKIDIKLLEG